jgi:transposase InsO family protein/predicted aspartyl protease
VTKELPASTSTVQVEGNIPASIVNVPYSIMSLRPVMDQTYKGHEDPISIDDFLFLWGLASQTVANEQKKAQFYHCLDRKVLFALKHSGIDFDAATIADLIERLKLLYSRIRLSGPAAEKLLKEHKLRPGQSAQSFCSELKALALDAQEIDEKKLISIFYETLPMHVLMAIGPKAKPDETLAQFTIRVDHPLNIFNQYGSSTGVSSSTGAASSTGVSSSTGAASSTGVSSSTGVFSVPSGIKYQVPRHGRNSAQSSNPHQPARSLSRPRSSSRTPSKKFSGTCFNCGKVGHRQVDCYSAPQTGNASTTSSLNGSRPRGRSRGPRDRGSGVFTLTDERLPALTVPVTIGDRVLTGVVDTGAQVSVLRLGCLSADQRSTIVYRTEQRQVANGSSLMIVGRFYTSVEVMGRTVSSVEVLVASNLAVDAVLGMGLLARLRMSIDCATRQLSLLDQPALCVVLPVADTESAPTLDASVPLSDTDAQRLARLLVKHSSLFNEIGKGVANASPMTIKLKEDARPPFIDYGGPSLSRADNLLIQKQVDSWLEEGVLVPTTSSSSTYLLVAMSNKGKPRVCPALLSLNRATVFEPHPMPTTDAVRRLVGTSSVFSVLDLKSAFTSMPLAEASQPLTAVRAPDGNHYQCTRVQWGLVNAATSFQRFIEGIIKEVPGTFVYIDDILCFADSTTAMFSILERLLACLSKANLCLNKQKCKFLQSSVPYLGNILGANSIRPDPARIAAIRAWEFPASTSEMKSFLGCCAFVSSFVKDYGLIKGILHPLLSSRNAYLPTQRQQAAFLKLKLAISSAVSLFQYQKDARLFLRTDASKVGLGGYLYQLGVDGSEQPLYYLSRVLTKTESNYDARKMELLAVRWCLRSLRAWVIGCPRLTVITDHESLQSCTSQVQENPTIQRWAAEIMEYAPTFTYRPGSSNFLADFLSRHPDLSAVAEDDDGDSLLQSRRVDAFQKAVKTATPILSIAPVSSTVVPMSTGSIPVPVSVLDAVWLDHKLLIERQQSDWFCSKALKALRTSQNGFAFSKANRGVPFFVDNSTGILLAKPGTSGNVIVAPASMVPNILNRMHDRRGHFREFKTLKAVKAEFFWPTLRKDVVDYLKNCLKCSESAPPPPSTMLKKGSLSSDIPNELVSSDLMGPFPRSATGECYVLTMTDHFSRFNLSLALKDTLSTTITRAIEERWINVFGSPRRLLTDNGSQYTSSVFDAMLISHGVVHVTTTTYNPRGDAIAERINRTLMNALKRTCEEVTDWPLHLPAMVFAHNSTVSSGTLETPFELMLGRPPPTIVSLPITLESQLINAKAAENRAKALNKLSATELTTINAYIPIPFALNDIVLLQDPVVPSGPGQKRLQKQFTRLYKVVGIQLPNVVSIVSHPVPGPLSKVSMRRIKMAPPNLQLGYQPSPSPVVVTPELANPVLPKQKVSKPILRMANHDKDTSKEQRTKTGRVSRPAVRFE